MSRETVLGAVVVLVAVQAGWIAALLVSRARRRRTEARNNAILRALPDLMFVQTRDGVYVDYNARDEALLFVPPSQFLGRKMRDIFPPPFSAMIEEKIQRLFDGEEPVIVEYEVPIPSGELRQFEARMVRCESDKFLSIIRDITAEKRAAAALQNAQLELMRASKLATLGEFAASIAHELAQPLTAIIANSRASLRLLERGENDLGEVRRSLHRRARVLARRPRCDPPRLRHLFGQGNPEQAPLDLTAIVNEVCMMVSATLLEHRIALDVRLDVGQRTILGDRVQLRQVILNLISNGIQAMEHVADESTRRLSILATLNPDGTARLTVSDTGVGLANVDRARLFSESYTTKPDGMGWGLSISRSIIEAHGGRLWAEANDGGGASFSFTLPLPS